MQLMHNPIYKNIAENIKTIIDSHFEGHGLETIDLYKNIQPAPNLKMGHFAFACFPLAKALKMGPPQIAGQIVEKISKIEGIKEAKAMGPYINFFIDTKEFAENEILDVISGKYFERKLDQDYPRTMVEYSQPNTHKELHVGHMRNLCLGNAIIETHKYIGHDIVSATYPGDIGTHVAKTLWYLTKHNDTPAPETNKGTWLGATYSKANNLLEEQRGTELEEQNRADLTEILKQLHEEKGEYFDLWKETREWSIDLMKEVYAWADVEFDRWIFESEVDAPSVKYCQDLYEQGKLIKDNGAIGMDLSEDKLGFLMLVKSDGNGLYATKDIELAKVKFEEFGIKQSIYVVDNRQAHHFKQVFKGLEKLGFEQAKDCFHLQYDVVELPSGAMSSRKGNIIPISDLINKMQETITANYLEKYRGDWSDEEIFETAKTIANGAIKYGMTRIDNNRKIVFDMDEWLKLDGETGPYLQYVYARINSLIKKFDSEIQVESADFTTLEKEQELALLLKLSQFNSIALSSAEQHKTVLLCTYLYELGKAYNSFYAECSINNAETEQLKAARYLLSKATGLVMKKGLSLLGIKAPERM